MTTILFGVRDGGPGWAQDFEQVPRIGDHIVRTDPGGVRGLYEVDDATWFSDPEDMAEAGVALDLTLLKKL